MQRLSSLVLFSAALFTSINATADEGAPPVSAQELLEAPPLPVEIVNPEATPTPLVVEPIQIATPPKKTAPKEVLVDPFTGRIKGKKVRLRSAADLESRVVKELSKGDLVVVLGEKGNFYAVEPPPETKAYVFRRFILDGVVEGSRVNVRLEPSVDAPVISHLNSGDHVEGVISEVNNKWYEIAAPQDTHFYIAKEYIEKVGGPELKVELEMKRNTALDLLSSAATLVEKELQKPYQEIDIEKVCNKYEAILSKYSDIPDVAKEAKEELQKLQEAYTQKKIAFADQNSPVKSQLNRDALSMNPTDRMKLWAPVEEALYKSWTASVGDRPMKEFYEAEKERAITLSGLVEAYSSPVKQKPGDFILRGKELPVGYLYSTKVNLQECIGRKVTVVAVPRENNNFAFPAYYVLDVE